MEARFSIGVAPMEGVTELPFRAWLWQTSAPEVMATPFLRVTPTYPRSELPAMFAPELFALRSYVPYALVPQLMAANAEDFTRVAALFREASDFVELNCGCPSPSCVGSGAGSSLLRDPAVFHGTIERLTQAVGPARLAVKMRTGFAVATELGTLIDGIRGAPLARLTVHGRTRVDGYKGRARWDLIAKVAAKMTVPVVASGDIISRDRLQQLRAVAPLATGVIIGRGVLRNPWIFHELRGATVTLTTAGLVDAVACFALLHQLNLSGRLVDLIRDGLLQSSAGLEEDAWAALLRRLTIAAFGSERAAIDVTCERVVLGRTKMLWNHLRGSLPKPYFAPQVLRSAELPVLIAGIENCARIHGAARVEVCHNVDHDWMFSGEKRASETDNLLPGKAESGGSLTIE